MLPLHRVLAWWWWWWFLILNVMFKGNVDLLESQ